MFLKTFSRASVVRFFRASSRFAVVSLASAGFATWSLPSSAASIKPAHVDTGPCGSAIAAAERAWRLPAGLLPAIARVESGRIDPATGTLHPWPWTINAEGTGHFFDSKEEAIAAVSALQARGVRSVDVGCMQVNLMHHPLAFATLDEAFEPEANAHYAGNFLNALSRQLGSWPLAAAAYHSQTPDLAADYQRLVMAAWGHPELATLARSWPVPPAPELPPAIRAVMPQQQALRAFMPEEAALRSFGRTEHVAALAWPGASARRAAARRMAVASLRPDRWPGAR